MLIKQAVFLTGKIRLKELSEALGKEMIETFNTSDTRGNSPSYGTNYLKLGKDIMARAKADADRDNRERWEREGRIAPTKKQDMEL